MIFAMILVALGVGVNATIPPHQETEVTIPDDNKETLLEKGYDIQDFNNIIIMEPPTQ